MKTKNEPDVPCSICGAEHDPDEAPEVDSTHLCPPCARSQRALQLHHAAPAPDAGSADAE